MSLYQRLGITNLTLDDLSPDSAEGLRALERLTAPLRLVRYDRAGDLCAYVAGGEELWNSAFRDLLPALLRHSVQVDARDGTKLLAIDESHAQIMLCRLEELLGDSVSALLELDEDLDRATVYVWDAVEGERCLAATFDRALLERAVTAVERRFSGYREGFLDLEDLIDNELGAEALASMVDLYRTLLVASVQARLRLEAAGSGRQSLTGAGEAAALAALCEGELALRLGHVLEGLAERTPSLPERHALPAEADASGRWVDPCARLGRAIVRWTIEREGSSHVLCAGRLWPGPALFTDTDESGATERSAVALARALGEKDLPTMLCGTHETVVRGGCVEVAASYLRGDDWAFVSVADEPDCGCHLVCCGERRHFARLAELIGREQLLEAEAWEDDFDSELALLALGKRARVLGEGEEGRWLSLEGLPHDLPFSREDGTEVTVIGAGDHFEVWRRKDYERISARVGGELAAVLFGE